MLLPYQLNDDTQLYSDSYVAVDLSGIARIRVSGNFLWNEIHHKFEVKECLASFGAESFVFQFAIQKFKD